MKKRKGFTLIEVIISIAIIGIVAMAVLAMFSSGTKNLEKLVKELPIHYKLRTY